MKRLAKPMLAGLLAALCLWAFCLPAGAIDSQQEENWYLTFTKDKKMSGNFDSGSISKLVQGMQPGDSSDIVINLRNESSKATNWYMLNEAITSLEDGTVAEGGAYTYRLTYTDRAGKVNVLFDSETVGGETDGVTSEKEGLHQATDSMEDFFYLDTLQTGDTAKVELHVALDGETQNNLYQNTIADVEMEFAVDEVNDNNTSSRNQVVKTGDETNLLPLYALMAASGVLLLIIACFSVKKKRESGEEGSRHER
ncbi:hypothetical protein [Acutalibacter sp. JLR.KK004]|jgi:hypothetical protein|uniref:hypothetical protein n=1 Tax=Acutalibacter sp. JLR.KK004 TaxID=3112622 RepID=UPI00216F4333|nr:hypothetical protein [Acutalibacter sp.]